MADDQRDTRESLAEQLDKDLEEHIQSLYEKNKDYKYTDGLKAENLDEVPTSYNVIVRNWKKKKKNLHFHLQGASIKKKLLPNWVILKKLNYIFQILKKEGKMAN